MNKPLKPVCVPPFGSLIQNIESAGSVCILTAGTYSAQTAEEATTGTTSLMAPGLLEEKVRVCENPWCPRVELLCKITMVMLWHWVRLAHTSKGKNTLPYRVAN